MLAKLIDYEPDHLYTYVIGYAMDNNDPLQVIRDEKQGIILDGIPDYIAVELDEDEIDPDVEDYLNGFDKVAISRTNCPICGEDCFNGWRCNCLSEDAQTKFQWRYK